MMRRGSWQLIADIGGTNARFALLGSDGVPIHVQTLAVAQFDDPLSA